MFIRDFLPKYLGKAIGAGENLVEAPHTELVGQQMEAMKESFLVAGFFLSSRIFSRRDLWAAMVALKSSTQSSSSLEGPLFLLPLGVVEVEAVAAARDPIGPPTFCH